MAARTGRSIFGYGELVRFSMSDPPGELWPRLPRPVEVPVRPAQECYDDRQDEDRHDEREEDPVLEAPGAVEPDSRRGGRAAVQPGPRECEGDEDPRQQHSAEEGAVDREGTDVDRRVGHDLLEPQEVPGSLRRVRR